MTENGTARTTISVFASDFVLAALMILPASAASHELPSGPVAEQDAYRSWSTTARVIRSRH